MIRVGLLDTSIPGIPGSMGRYRDQLKTALADHGDSDLEVSVEYLGCDQDTLRRTPAKLRMWRRHYHVWRAAKRLPTNKYDVVHLLDGSFGYAAGAVRSDRVVVTVHDVIPRLQMEGVFPEAPPVGRGARWIINACLSAIARTATVCADSQCTADDLQRFGCHPKGGIQVVPLAIEQELFEGPRLAPADAGVDGPFIFNLANNGFYKNRRGAIEVFKRIDPALNARLVLAGPRPDESLSESCHASGVADRIIMVNHPDQEHLKNLYCAASVFLFPSRYEGFGWPPLEAMAAGCPVVASDAGSLPEVIGDSGIMANSDAYDEMARGCERLLSEPAFRQTMVDAGKQRVEQFGRDRLATAMTNLYRKTMERRP